MERRKRERERGKRAEKENFLFSYSTLLPSTLVFSFCSLSFLLLLSLGKSGNINNVARQLYGHTRGRVPGNELICIFDADQVRELRREKKY